MSRIKIVADRLEEGGTRQSAGVIPGRSGDEVSCQKSLVKVNRCEVQPCGVPILDLSPRLPVNSRVCVKSANVYREYISRALRCCFYGAKLAHALLSVSTNAMQHTLPCVPNCRSARTSRHVTANGTSSTKNVFSLLYCANMATLHLPVQHRPI